MEIDLQNAVFELDELQDELIRNYIMADKTFKRAYFTDLTAKFFSYMKKKCEMNEPVTLSIMGTVRGGKSSTAIAIAAYIAKQRGLPFTVRNIVANEFAYVETLKCEDIVQGMPFVIDESKQTVYGIGSIAKRMKILDIQNIIAMKAISTIWIRPDRFSYEGAQYGLRVFGKANNVKPRLVRLMLYNLQESRDATPIGMVYCPIYNDVDWIEDTNQLHDDYIAMKTAWVEKEQIGEGDVLYVTKKKRVLDFVQDPVFINLPKKKERELYVRHKLGSEFTTTEVKEISQTADMIIRGAVSVEDLNIS